ncbi:MAG: hypothetical protein E6R07_08375 [Nevskiaceae bacterium]|nr:MAG: hypothetical protein E6R07_08375 [Nevskiaceae bacterium]
MPLESINVGRSYFIVNGERLFQYRELDTLGIGVTGGGNENCFFAIDQGFGGGRFAVWDRSYGCQLIADAFLTLKDADTPAGVERQLAAFDLVADRYRAADVKPEVNESIRRYEIQAEDAINRKDFDAAVDAYTRALDANPWWPQGHYNVALILGELQDYRNAAYEMSCYLKLVPEAPNARAAQDKIYAWQGQSR